MLMGKMLYTGRESSESFLGSDVLRLATLRKWYTPVHIILFLLFRIPHCIKLFPGVVLDIVLSSPSEHTHVDSSVGVSSLVSRVAPNSYPIVDPADAPVDSLSEGKFGNGLRVTSATAEMPSGDTGTCNLSSGPLILPPALPSMLNTTSKTALSFMEVVKLASKMAKESDGQVQRQEMSTQMAYIIKLHEASDAKQDEMNQLQRQALLRQEKIEHFQKQVLELQRASDVKQEKMSQLQRQALDQQEEMKQLALDHHEEIKQLHIQALGQLAILQGQVKAVLTQTYELHEYPIPRLFIVLPQDSSRWDILNPFAHKFRLYFLCECGEHTKSVNSKRTIPHHIHLAKHQGYDIARPSEFFQQYGTYVLTILKMLKFGIEVAGIAMPALSHLISAEIIDQATTSLQQLKDQIKPGVDQVISYIDKVSVDEGKDVEGASGSIEDNEALEGADLRKLDTFLANKDVGKVLGNLYRTVTAKGHVKWVCLDHYRENYQENAFKLFRDAVDSLGGSYDKNFGRVEVKLLSKVLADQFYSALCQAKSVHDIKIELSWETSYNDLKSLRNTLLKRMLPPW